MQCSDCGKNEAVVHLTQIENNEMRTFHLCQSCAAGKGVETSDTPESAPLADFLAQMGKSGGVETAPATACDFCGLTLAAFKKTGRLGCAHCYSQFEQHLRALLRKLHGGTRHVGKIFLPPDPTRMDRAAQLGNLRATLQRAVDAEDFERAAALRDEIRRHEAGT